MIDRNKPELPLDRRRILLIEGNSNLLSNLSLILFRAGAWDVWQAHNAARARELWREHSESIDVVIADEHLPDGRGTDLLSEFCFDDPQLSSLLMSDAPARDADQLSSARFLSKPFTERELISALISS